MSGERPPAACGNCAWSRRPGATLSRNPQLSCHYHPPTVIASEYHRQTGRVEIKLVATRTVWPDVSPDDVCAHHAPNCR